MSLPWKRIVRRLREDGGSPVMIEFGSFWTYYGLWFCQALPASRVVAVEPDPAWLEVGRRNAVLNGFTGRVDFVQAAIGAEPGAMLAFRAESDGQFHDVVQHDLASLMAAAELDRVDLILADVQGAETVLLDRAKDDFQAGRVRFVVISTHHHSISGSPVTHQDALTLVRDAGGHVISEHTVGESFSGDGLIYEGVAVGAGSAAGLWAYSGAVTGFLAWVPFPVSLPGSCARLRRSPRGGRLGWAGLGRSGQGLWTGTSLTGGVCGLSPTLATGSVSPGLADYAARGW